MKPLFIGLIVGLILGIIVISLRSFYAKNHNETFFLFDKNLDQAGVHKRKRNIYTWTVFGFLIGLIFIIPSLNTDQSNLALVWSYLIGFALIFISIIAAVILYKQTSNK
ncbi:hypothetical protein [Lactobacillus kalixensis]|uniref:DUF3784 domain-containing protein n=1 Tax=Lactobacillus kalixensis DSM 16043 TaxID=1423763 RepID=A0A0R1UDK7_9LACO|nr:hypothetical protein [Lactobacillus kalixensis]KRL91526.1 hypothetical protein FC46_GL000075 [Lactobacillus kalixensis DSM 16043]